MNAFVFTCGVEKGSCIMFMLLCYSGGYRSELMMWWWSAFRLIFMVHSETVRYAIDDDGNYVYGCSAFMTRPCDFQWCQPHLMASIHLQSCQVFCSQRLLACVLRLSCAISGTRYFKYVKHYYSCECSKCEDYGTKMRGEGKGWLNYFIYQ